MGTELKKCVRVTMSRVSTNIIQEIEVDLQNKKDNFSLIISISRLRSNLLHMKMVF